MSCGKLSDRDDRIFARARAAVSRVHSSILVGRCQKKREKVADGGEGDSRAPCQVGGVGDAGGIEDSQREGQERIRFSGGAERGMSGGEVKSGNSLNDDLLMIY